MNRNTKVTIAFAVIFVLVAVGLFRAPAVQDFVLARLATSLAPSAQQDIDGMQVVVCGSASPLGNTMDRAQACIAVLTQEHLFLIDVGARSPTRIAQAQLPLDRLSAVFLTHYHSDHIAGLGDVNLNSWVAGRQHNMQVYGPEGVQTVVDGFNQAYALDRSYRTQHHGEELLPKALGPMRANTLDSGIVWQDESMTVRGFVVDHHPANPTMGYRFDYQGRSVVISGDTNATDELFAAAQGADLLFHDALARHLLNVLQQTMRDSGRSNVAQLIGDVTDYHADSLTLEDAAKAADIKQLVLYHLVPTPMNAMTENLFLRGLSDEVILAHDLQVFELSAQSETITIRP
ncbi:MAG: MBL fold metallo-hydrolase [Proteobacteria bacterium]|nr:MBL fold metallo-hydrolase [Pseudomonadota bacterium]